jgi:hypothetical protein
MLRLPGFQRRLVSLLLLVFVVSDFIKELFWRAATFEVGPGPVIYVGGDFETFHRAAQDLAAGRSPYPAWVADPHAPIEVGAAWGNYIYPPLFARLLEPLAGLDVVHSKLTYLFVCFILYFGLFLWEERKRDREVMQRWLRWGFVFGWGASLQTFIQGQSDFLPLLLAASAWILVRNRENGGGENSWAFRDGAAGMLLGVAAMVKITPLLILPVLVAVRAWRLVGGFVFGVVGALLLSGPLLSWQYFTRVLPAMRDFAGMKWVPSLHMVLMRGIEHLPFPSGLEQVWPHWAQHLGIALSCLFYGGLLFLFGKGREAIRLGDVILLSCFLPPLFAGEVAHHYALALLPALEGARRLVSACEFPAPWGPRPRIPSPETPSPGIRRNRWMFAVLLFALAPSFYYWDWIKVPIEWFIPLDLSARLVLGNLAAFLLILSFFFRQGGTKQGGLSTRPAPSRR